jgi:hypothetical protein
MAFYTFPYFFQRFTDSEGLPLAGGSLTFYSAGSGALKNIYLDQSGQKAQNPMPLDSTGLPVKQYFGEAGEYDIFVRDSNGALVTKLLRITALGGSGFPTPGNSGYLHYDIDTGTYEWIDIDLNAGIPILESVSLVGCSTFRHLGGDLNTPNAIGAYFFAKDEIEIARVCTVIPTIDSMAAGDIQFAIYKPQYNPVSSGDVPMIGIAGNVEMDKIASGAILPASATNIYAVGTLTVPVKVQGWFCVVLSNTPASSWPSIYASANLAEMMSMAEQQYQVPLQFVRNDIVNPNEQVPDMWPDTINSLYGSNSHILNKNVIPYIRLEIA